MILVKTNASCLHLCVRFICDDLFFVFVSVYRVRLCSLAGNLLICYSNGALILPLDEI